MQNQRVHLVHLYIKAALTISQALKSLGIGTFVLIYLPFYKPNSDQPEDCKYLYVLHMLFKF